VLLVLLALGWREALIVGAAVIVTLAITLFASWAWGFTLNRVSLFALIFSIGILVDDAIVVVENIHRHLQLGAKNLLEAIPRAVDEVGGPTILATFTVIAALLADGVRDRPDGALHEPHPDQRLARHADLAGRGVRVHPLADQPPARPGRPPARRPRGARGAGRARTVFRRVITPFLEGRRGWVNRWKLLGAIIVLIVGSLALAGVKLVVLKMLPFDNKSEFQVVLDMPEGTSLEHTARVLEEIGNHLAGVPEVSDYQVYAGTNSPIGFNGLVRQYYLRSGANVGDIQVNLVDKAHRHRKSHDVARSVREPIQAIAWKHGGNAKIVEVPPGPPCSRPSWRSLWHRLRRPDRRRQAGARYLPGDARHRRRRRLCRVPFREVRRPGGPRQAARLGVAQTPVAQALATVLSGEA